MLNKVSLYDFDDFDLIEVGIFVDFLVSKKVVVANVIDPIN